jgi:hypothetical protein
MTKAPLDVSILCTATVRSGECWKWSWYNNSGPWLVQAGAERCKTSLH